MGLQAVGEHGACSEHSLLPAPPSLPPQVPLGSMKTHIPTHWLALELQSTLQTHTAAVDTPFRIYMSFVAPAHHPQSGYSPTRSCTEDGSSALFPFFNPRLSFSIPILWDLLGALSTSENITHDTFVTGAGITSPLLVTEVAVS